jgi:hypothetical protein
MLNMNWTLSAVMLAAAFAGTASQASAQSERYRGSFTLPFEARFGTVVLQPGNYSVSTLDGAKGIRITGDRGKVAILAAGYDLKPVSEKAKMIMVDSGGIYALQSFESGAMGKAFRFVVAKNPHATIERAAVVKPAIEVGLQ